MGEALTSNSGHAVEATNTRVKAIKTIVCGTKTLFSEAESIFYTPEAGFSMIII
jgi:hypothetical protein